jgi:hypothetical protein
MKLLFDKNSQLYNTLYQTACSAKIVMFSGLPGVGKSLYINQFHQIAQQQGRSLTVIQWDIARKGFETPEISAFYPLGDGLAHPGVLVAAGAWLMETVQEWILTHSDSKNLLLIEAPLIGNRFVELVKKGQNEALEDFLQSDQFQVLVPLPVWTGAKRPVLLALWRMMCRIAHELGKNVVLTEEQPPYDPAIYSYVFERVLKYRHHTFLHLDTIYAVSPTTTDTFHQLPSLVPNPQDAYRHALQVRQQYPTDEALTDFVKNWFKHDGGR